MKYVIIASAVFIMAVQKCDAQTDTRNGYYLPAVGEFKVLLVFADCVGDSEYVSGWEKGALPNIADNLLDTVFLGANSLNGKLTKYYYDMSFGRLKLLGDYYPTLIEIEKDSLKGNGDANILNALKANFDTTFHGYTIARDFDQWSLKSNYYPKANKPDGYVDLLLIVWRSNPSFAYKRAGSISFYRKNFQIGDSRGFNGVGRIASYDFSVLKHEIAHGFLGGNNFHCADANAGEGTFLGSYSGISMLSGEQKFGIIAHPQERRILGWNADSCPDGICAFNNSGHYMPADIHYASLGNKSDTFLLRDYCVFGDAVRIELPYLQSQDENVQKQWLWILNHQKENSNFQINNACEKGIYIYLQVGVEGYERLHAKTNYFIPLNEFGNYDFVLHDTVSNSTVFDAQKKYANAFTGASSVMYVPSDYKEDEMEIGHEEFVSIKQLLYESEVMKNETFGYLHYTGYGSSLIAFREGSELSLNTNPAPTPMLTYTTPYRKHRKKLLNMYPSISDNRFVYLNTLRIKIESIDSVGNASIIIDNNGNQINGKKRWCGPLILKDSLFLQKETHLIFDQGLTAQRPNNPIVYDSKYVFADPTHFLVDSSAYVKANNSLIQLKGNSTIELADFSKLVLKNSVVKIAKGSTCIIANASQIVFAGRSTIVVEGTLILGKGQAESIMTHVKLKRGGEIRRE